MSILATAVLNYAWAECMRGVRVNPTGGAAGRGRRMSWTREPEGLWCSVHPNPTATHSLAPCMIESARIEIEFAAARTASTYFTGTPSQTSHPPLPRTLHDELSSFLLTTDNVTQPPFFYWRKIYALPPLARPSSFLRPFTLMTTRRTR